MPDTEVGGPSLGYILAPAADDQIPIGTGVADGGFSRRADFVHNDGSGKYLCAGPLGLGAGVTPIADLSVRGAGSSIGFNVGAIVSPIKGNLYFETDGSGWRFDIGKYQSASFSPLLCFRDDNNLHPGADNAQAFGVSWLRWSTFYAATGSINTSDGTEKTELRGFSAAELSAAKRIAGSLGIFQFLASIAEKGEAAARLHIGVIAQDVWAIMADEGLIDPITTEATPSSRYAFLCYDEWDADEAAGVAPGTRFGIRPDQLALFLIAAQEARLAAIEAAL